MWNKKSEIKNLSQWSCVTLLIVTFNCFIVLLCVLFFKEEKKKKNRNITVAKVLPTIIIFQRFLLIFHAVENFLEDNFRNTLRELNFTDIKFCIISQGLYSTENAKICKIHLILSTQKHFYSVFYKLYEQDSKFIESYCQCVTFTCKSTWTSYLILFIMLLDRNLNITRK